MSGDNKKRKPGRPPGSKNKKALVRLDKDAAAVAAQVSKLKAEHKLHTLGKDRLAEIDDLMFRYALAFSPVEEDEEGKRCRPFWESPADEQRFLRFMALSYDCAKARAPYESPRYAAIAMACQQQDDDPDDPYEGIDPHKKLEDLVTRFFAAKKAEEAEKMIEVRESEPVEAKPEIDDDDPADGEAVAVWSESDDDPADGEAV